jgi:ABC-type transporter Mla MlaB component
MAKYRHRIFEMYEGRDEAIDVLKPMVAKTAAETTALETWNFVHLKISRQAGVSHVQFKKSQRCENGTESDLREDLTRLADLLGRDSKVLVDFSGVESFNAASLAALVRFRANLQTKGSRIALCCLNPTVRESFFAGG